MAVLCKTMSSFAIPNCDRHVIAVDGGLLACAVDSKMKTDIQRATAARVQRVSVIDGMRFPYFQIVRVFLCCSFSLFVLWRG